MDPWNVAIIDLSERLYVFKFATQGGADALKALLASTKPKLCEVFQDVDPPPPGRTTKG
jgi:hypothetical protein